VRPFLLQEDVTPQPVSWRWHLLAILVMALAAPLTMRGWFADDLLPAGDAAGYMAMVDYIRETLLRYGRVPSWCTKWFAGSAHFMSTFKELATFPLALQFGPVLGTKLMFLVTKGVAAFGMYLILARFFRCPVGGLIAGYAYGFGAPANYQVALGGHLDVGISYALFPFIFVASVELLRARRWDWAVMLGVLVACQLGAHFVQAMVCPMIFAVVLCLRPWRKLANEDDPLADRALAKRWAALMCGALISFLLFAASGLAWLAADMKNHALKTPDVVASGLEQFIEQSPFMYLNRDNWLGWWLESHRPPGLLFDSDDPAFNARRYLGVVAMAVCVTGWFFARRSYSLRRWYQAFALVFLFQYWMSMGPRTLLWQLAETFHWPDWVEGPLHGGLTLGSLGCLVWAGLLILRRRAPVRESRSIVRIELAVGLALILFFSSHSLFDIARVAIPILHGMRSPGHFFDLAPFSFYGLFGVGLVAIARAIPRSSMWHGLAVALALMVVLDFWPSTRAFHRGTPMGPVREFQRVVSELPAEDGTLRMTMFPRKLEGVSTLVVMDSEVGAAWSWLNWQSGKHWWPYLRTAMLPLLSVVEPEKRDLMRPVGDVLGRVARIKYVLDEVPPRLSMERPWTLRAANSLFALWERPDVMPMAYGYRSYLLAFGEDDSAATVTWAFPEGVLVVSAGQRLSHASARLIEGAALVAYRDPSVVEDERSRLLAQLYAGKLVRAGHGAQLRERLSGIAAHLPRESVFDVGYRRPGPEDVVLEADASEEPALIFLSESYHPWWRATVDGRAAPVLRAQMAFMAVPIDQGQHVINLRFCRPMLVVIADWVTVAAWIMLPLAGAVYAVMITATRRGSVWRRTSTSTRTTTRCCESGRSW